MNRTLPLSRVADVAAASLSGGQAPRSWRRECAQRATRLRALSRAAYWGDALCAPAPGLTETPLWGECLAELATQTQARTEDTSARSRPPGAAPREGARPSARPAHAPHEFDHARRQTSTRRTSTPRTTSPPPLPRAFQQHAASAPVDDPQLSGVNRSAPIGREQSVVGREQSVEGQSSYFRAWPHAPLNENQRAPFNVNQHTPVDDNRRAPFKDNQRTLINENQDVPFVESSGEHTRSAHATFDSPEASARSNNFPSSVRAGVETHESVETFVPGMEVLSRQASHELLCRLAGQNNSHRVQNQKSSRVAPASRSRADASANSGTALSKSYGAAPSLAEEGQSNRPHAQAKTTPRATATTKPPLRSGQQPHNSRRTLTLNAPVYRSGRVQLPDVAARHARGRQWWSVLATRTARALRLSGVLPAAAREMDAPTTMPGETGASLLTRQLFFTVNGETAPQDLLQRLAGGSVAASGAAKRASEQRSGSGTGVGRQSSAPRSSQSETPQTFLDAGSNRFTNGDASVALPHQSTSPGLDANQLGMSATAEASAPGVNTSLLSVNNYLSGAETSLRGAAAAPVVADSLPPLLPSPLVGMPILPIALAAAREGARDESLESAEDLDALAAKIKFILDEQARRHGIDV